MRIKTIVTICITHMIIALCGRRRSGKDVIASHLVDEHAFSHHKIAQPLKDALSVLFGFTSDELESSLKEEIHPDWGVSPRTLMQYIGTDIFRDHIQHILPGINADFWIKRALVPIKTLEKVVISDLRFLNEYLYLRQMCGKQLIVVRLNRFDTEDNSTCGVHISEREFEQIPADVVIKNNGTIVELIAQINAYINQIATIDDPLQD